ncbi:helicase HerA-like domain-containing protein [Streptococcus merionis]|uniref:helicase HerA-like domain-containing protein n=1 Tax=Streptococcus merionis TaxID=400065 RepID=UPI0026E9F026|nr:helicase HerA-like domain-containing protein [Streptococcus merionis]
MTRIQVAQGRIPIEMELGMLNRHGLIAGATGTGKTVTLKVIAEQLSLAGVPVFLADIKGDLTSLATPGEVTEKLAARLEKLGITDFEPRAFPVRLWDVFGEQGHPVRTTVSEMGPMLLSRLLNLNDTQTGVLNIVFKIADEKGWLLIDLKDLQAILRELADNSKDYTGVYGNIAKATVGAIQRSLLALEQEGGHTFFGEPGLNLADFMQLDADGQGIINVLSANKLFQSPLLYSTFLLWMLAELYEMLPEVGDVDKPKLVFFFDEAHLLFKDAPKVFVDKVEQIVRLVRSKGVGVFFVTQNPIDLPEAVLAQLGNRVQHALRAYTPRELKAVKTAAETFRQNPELDVTTTITELEVGEALISFLNESAQPSVVERAFVFPPLSSFGTVDAMTIQGLINQSPLDAKYRETLDRESAFELLAAKILKDEQDKAMAAEQARLEKERKALEKEQKRVSSTRRPRTAVEKATDSFINSAVRTIGRELARGILGSLRGKR